MASYVAQKAKLSHRYNNYGISGNSGTSDRHTVIVGLVYCYLATNSSEKQKLKVGLMDHTLDFPSGDPG